MPTKTKKGWQGWAAGFTKRDKAQLGSEKDDEVRPAGGLGNIPVHPKDEENGFTWREGGW